MCVRCTKTFRFFRTKNRKMEEAPKEKVAVLGGGISALTAAFWLARVFHPFSSRSDLFSFSSQTGKYDVTVYQMGWRLGGKAASGRNTDMGERIEEHLIHVMFGFYRNVFRTMKQVMLDLYKDEAVAKEKFEAMFLSGNFLSLSQFRPRGQGIFAPQFNAWVCTPPSCDRTLSVNVILAIFLTRMKRIGFPSR